ncbi:hypothetical protein Q4530_07355 [Colwellia sp. 1_MG-2023]|uniref:hypothetical protein n=1 Tax=unclassified Colwellia TaxID=196834 RepID=UPI001C0862F8|nr:MULTISPECIES: hypothetical protein [unclassified Colwellia]MBU2926448.1 hypothetical protein [Colwellia sp. C2M11]MDO6652486.1 hypothetical protein [Colwellia sp. 3_MG-2023]MDO6665087.1 hypothetical protein [Colwellia sp. 2_MG-2023]MDO6689591.1 hypothetical protein [Colwellia sp. 1_MG-2023]
MLTTEFEDKIIELLEERPAPAKHSARAAINHIEMAFKIENIDPEMAVFRAICAEEEAATAIIKSLKRLKYPGSKSLNFRSHVHKSAIYPFVCAITRNLAQLKEVIKDPKIVLNEELSPNGETLVRIRYTQFFQDSFNNIEEKWAYPYPPLNFSFKYNGGEYDFANELNQIANESEFDEILKYVKKQANKRNEIIYAHTNGIPTVESMGDFLKHKKSVVFILVIIYLIIDPYKEHQLFVNHSIKALLSMLNLMPDDVLT